jgi:hypothetical protein
MQTEYILPRHHHIDTLRELMHSYPLHQRLLNLKSQYKAPGCHIVNLLTKTPFLRYRVNFYVLVHEEVLELVHGARVDEPLRHVREQVEQAVLADAEDALGVGAVL